MVTRLFLWPILVSASIGGLIANGRVIKCSDKCCPGRNEKIIKQCLGEGKVAHIPTFKCFDVNSQGECDDGELLVVMEKSECMATKCVENISCNGKPCPEGLLAYNGKCEISGSKSLCQDKGLGKRLLADLYGTVACRCAVDLGYVDVNGRCYHEYFRGPCEEGEQIVRNGTCVRHSCKQGEVQWAQDGCFQLENPYGTCEDMYDLGEGETERLRAGQNLKDLIKVKCIGPNVRSGGTFVNCAVKANDGTCLGRRRPPKVEITSRLLRDLFSELNSTSKLNPTSNSDSKERSILPRTNFGVC